MLHNKKEQATGLQVFNFNEKESTPIRVQVINKEPWFVAKDVCRVLGVANHKDAVSRLDDDERHGVGITDPLGRSQKVIAINESGLYHLIFQSRKPEAKKFRRWVTSEVLPTLRKTGKYELKSRRRVLPRDRGEDIRAFYDELTRWITKEDERMIAETRGVGVRHVTEVLRGRKPSYQVTAMLVAVAKENRKRGIERVVVTPHRDEEVRELMFDFLQDA